MRNVPLDSVDAVARPVLAIGTDYPPGTLLDTHTHRRAQVLYGMSGVMEVETDDGAWAIPPYSGVWIPAGKPHRVRMQGCEYAQPLHRAGCRAPADHCEALVISLCCTSCCWPRRTCLRCTTRTGVTERWRNCCCMRCARRRRCPCSRRSPRPPACTAVQGIPEVAQHPGHAPGMGAATAQEPAHLHALLSPADGYEFWGGSKPACWRRCPGCRPGSPSRRWRWIWATTAPARFPRCSSDGSARRQWSSSANPTRPHPGRGSVSQS